MKTSTRQSKQQVEIRYGVLNFYCDDLAGQTIQAVLDEWGDPMNIPHNCVARVGARKANMAYILQPGDTLEFFFKSFKHGRDERNGVIRYHRKRGLAVTKIAQICQMSRRQVYRIVAN